MSLDKIPLVTVIALCYNQSSFISDALNSVKDQTYQNIELIVIDDHSSDDSVQQIEKWIASYTNSIKLIVHDTNQGICKTINQGLRRASGKYIQLLACDDILDPKKIEHHVRILEANPEKALVFSDVHIINSDGKPIGKTYFDTRKYAISDTYNPYCTLIRKGNFMHPLSQLIRKEILVELGGYDESLWFEDYDMNLRITKKYSVIYDLFVSAFYRQHATNAIGSLASIKAQRTYFYTFLKQYSRQSEFEYVLAKRVNRAIENIYSQSPKQALEIFKDSKDIFPFSLKFKMAVSLNIPYRVYKMIQF